jgi:DnaK suppressor protein
MAKKIVKPVKKASKPAPKKAASKPVKKVSKPAPKAIKKAAKPAPKPAKKVVTKKTAPKPVSKKPAPKPVAKATKPAPKKVEKKTVKPVAKTPAKPVKKTVAPAPKKVEVKASTGSAAKTVKEIAKPKTTGKPIDAVAKKGGKTSAKVAKGKKKGKKGDDDEEDDVEPEEEDDSDVDVKDDYEKPEEEDDVILDADLDGPPVLDLEGGGIPLDDDDDEIPEKRGRGRRKKNEGRSSGSESYIRNRPLHIDITKPLIKKPTAAQPKPFLNTTDKRSRYSDKELGEFKELILDKLKEAQTDYDLLKQTLSNADNHGTDDTSPSFKLLEDGSDVLSKEETAQLAVRQEKYIVNLKNALMRIENKTYGICRVTGKLIPKERLRSVPHATLGIDAKLSQ